MTDKPKHPNRLREVRLDRELTLDDVAERANTSATQISRLERGIRRMTFDWARRLAPILECHPQELIGPPPELPPDEAEVIEGYRGLSDRDQEAVRGLVRSLRSSKTDEAAS